jgi:hypothetical protein
MEIEMESIDLMLVFIINRQVEVNSTFQRDAGE